MTREEMLRQFDILLSAYENGKEAEVVVCCPLDTGKALYVSDRCRECPYFSQRHNLLTLQAIMDAVLKEIEASLDELKDSLRKIGAGFVEEDSHEQ